MRSLSRLKHLIFLAIVLAVAYLGMMLMRHQVVQVDIQQQSKYESEESIYTLNSQQKLHVKYSLQRDVNIVPSIPRGQAALQHNDCVVLPKSSRPGLYICVHPIKDDKWISGALKAGRLWEEHLVMEMVNALKADTSLQVVDLGCNIGQFSLCAAALDRRVLSVEMMMTNVQLLQMSLQLSNLSSMVTIVNNAVYKDHRELAVKFMKENIGGNRLNVSNTLDDVDEQAAKVTIKTICLNDLVPLVRSTRIYLKMDIENSEHFALQCAEEFFKEVDVKIVQMEWYQRQAEDGKVILSFMDSHNYSISQTASGY